MTIVVLHDGVRHPTIQVESASIKGRAFIAVALVELDDDVIGIPRPDAYGPAPVQLLFSPLLKETQRSIVAALTSASTMPLRCCRL
jgi:hypothetical protein